MERADRCSLRRRSVWTLLALTAFPVLAPGGAEAGMRNSAESAGVQATPVAIPPGETSLADIGIFSVHWQSYGKAAAAMPLGWTGHFDPATGISYQDWGQVLGHRALLMHSPWHVAPGRTWVEYPLALPNVTPIRLSFGIAMNPDSVGPGKSDGVTFACSLIAGGKKQSLMREHYVKAEWLDYHFDLSPYAGKTIVLGLQVEPGPKNDASFDLSLFGDAKITAGEGVEPKSEAIRRLVSSRANRVAAKANLVPLCNDATRGIVPSNICRGKNATQRMGTAWQFLYQGDDCRIAYTYRPATGTLDDFTVQVDDGQPFQPASGGGATVTVKQDGKLIGVPARGGRVLRVDEDHGCLRVEWEYQVGGQPLCITWSYRIQDKSLVVGAECQERSISRFSFGGLGPVPLRKVIRVPYLSGQLSYLPAERVFVCRYLDWTCSNASLCPQGEAVYEPKTDGSRNPLAERGFIAVSSNLGEVLPNIPHPPSPYLAVLGPRIMLDIWNHHAGTFRGNAENLLDLKDNGVDHVAIIQHVWQRYGYDVKLPDHLPADPHFGGDEGMIVFGKAANACGYLWSVHENYIDLYPDAPSYDPKARVLLADGSPSKAWFNGGTGVQSFGLKCNRALDYAKRNSPEIHRRFGTTAGYLDVHTCVPPWHQLDHEAGQPMSAMARAKVKYDRELFQFMRDTHGGPLFGEGCNQFYWAGLCDGVEAQVADGEDHAPLPDFDLLKLHPQMVNHGMGYYERWFRAGYGHRWGYDSGTMEQIDKYRAQELTYGHAGFVGADQVNNVQWVAREHHLVHPVQRLYGTAKVTEIAYQIDGQWVAAGTALALGDTSRQRIRYDSGLTLWVNWRAEPWRVEGRTLPQWGFLAMGPETLVSTSLVGGRFADYAECPEFLFADARTSFAMPYRGAVKDIEPRLRSFEYLGGNRVRVTYEWIVNDTLDRDLTCFVHGVGVGAASPEAILFQQDHALPKPTGQWRKGEVIVDGPYEFSLPPTQEPLRSGHRTLQGR